MAQQGDQSSQGMREEVDSVEKIQADVFSGEILQRQEMYESFITLRRFTFYVNPI